MFQDVKKLAACAALAIVAAAPQVSLAQDFPSKPIKVIVPFAAGGQGDVLARLIIKRIEELELLSQPMVVVNVPGGGTTIGVRQAKKADPDGHTLLYLHQTIMTSQLTGKLDFKYTELEAVAETNNTCLLTATAEGSGIESAENWIEQAKAEPKGMKEATLVGSAAHFTGAMIGKAAEMELGFVNAGGGAKRIASILGNHTKTAVLVATPVAKNPKLHAIVYYGEERNPQIPDTPTAKELGYDVVSCLNNVWWAPAGLPTEVTSTLGNAFKAVMADEALIKEIEAKGQEVSFHSGDELDARLADIYARLEAVAGDL